MDYAQFAQGISFKFLPPERRRPHGFRGLSRLLALAGVNLEAMNTVLPEEQEVIRARLARLAAVPRMSTFAIGALISRGVSAMPEGQVFVNVGVWNGFTFLSGCAGNDQKVCIGVDSYQFPHSPKEAFLARFEKLKGPAHRFHLMDYRDYFNTTHKEPIGFYIYDGDHHYEHQYEGLRIAERFLAKGAIVLVDDTAWDEPRRGTLDFIAKSEHKYEMILDVKAVADAHPTWWNGVMVFRKLD